MIALLLALHTDCRIASVEVYAFHGKPSVAYSQGYLRLVAVPRNAHWEPLTTYVCPDQDNPTWHFDPELRTDGKATWDVTLDPFGYQILIRGENLNSGVHWLNATFIQRWHGPGLSSPPEAPPGYAIRVGRRTVNVR